MIHGARSCLLTRFAHQRRRRLLLLHKRCQCHLVLARHTGGSKRADLPEAEGKRVVGRGDNSAGSPRGKIRDGRVCKLCGKKYSQPDDVVVEEKVLWARPFATRFPHGNY